MGFPNLFEEKNLEEESNQTCINLCNWLKKNNKENPSQKSKDPIEAKFAQWLTDRKQAKKGNGSSAFYESDFIIAKKMGFENLFNNLEEESNQTCINLCNWLKKNNKENPSRNSKDPIEAKFAQWLSNKRQAKKGNGYWAFYESDLKIAKKMGFPNLFEEKNKEEESNQKCINLCNWLKNNKENPSQKSKDPIEAKFAQWLSHRKKAKKGKHGIFYESDLKIANKMGFPNLFEEKNLEEESNQTCINLCNWLKKNNKENPSRNSKDPIEAKFAQWLTDRKKAKKGKRGIFYESDLKIAKSYGYKNLFDTRD
jgi:hypothetical protein